MKTIQNLKQVSEIMINSSYKLEIGSFSLINSSIVTFDLECSNMHLQALVEMGVSINFSSKIKSNSQNSNDFIFKAKATPYHLSKLENFSRFNHLNKVSIINNHQAVDAGFPIKGMRIEEGRLVYGYNFPKNESVKNHVLKIEAIRKDVRKKFKRETNLYTTRCSVKKLDY